MKNIHIHRLKDIQTEAQAEYPEIGRFKDTQMWRQDIQTKPDRDTQTGRVKNTQIWKLKNVQTNTQMHVEGYSEK